MSEVEIVEVIVNIISEGVCTYPFQQQKYIYTQNSKREGQTKVKKKK